MEPANAIIIADLKIHSALKVSFRPKARAVAPLIAPPKAPFDNILVSINIGKTYATPANSEVPIWPTYQRSNITVKDAVIVEKRLGIASLKKILEKGNSVNRLE